MSAKVNAASSINLPLYLNSAYCLTENAWVHNYHNSPMTVCPNNPSHVLDPASIQQVREITPQSQIIALSSKNYATGTVSQSGTTVTGSSTTFTSDMIGGLIIYSETGNASFITGYNSATSLTVADSFSESSQGYTIYYGGFQADYNGNTSIGAPLFLRNASNQIKLGPGSALTTINAVTPSASQVLSIPDTGSATANIITSEGAQVLNGKYNFNSTAANSFNLGQKTASLSFNPNVNTGAVTVNGNSGYIEITTTAGIPLNFVTDYFTVNNSAVSASSIVMLTISDLSTLAGLSNVLTSAITAYSNNVTNGSFRVQIYNISADASLPTLPAGTTFRLNFMLC